jgi:hypothetical protein
VNRRDIALAIVLLKFLLASVYCSAEVDPDLKGFNPVLVDWIQKPIQIRFCGGPE